jgi:hypothetical protein
VSTLFLRALASLREFFLPARILAKMQDTHA